MKTVLLTGISGYIGLHCAKELQDRGYRVRGTVRNQAKGKEVLELASKIQEQVLRVFMIKLEIEVTLM